MMRDLKKNKTKLWVVNIVSTTENVDDDGNLTGEYIDTYDTPKQVNLLLYPANGRVSSQIFGTDCKFDMMASSSTVELLPSTLLFLTEPVDSTKYYTTYDYRIEKINASLNVFQYGLEKRT